MAYFDHIDVGEARDAQRRRTHEALKAEREHEGLLREWNQFICTDLPQIRRDYVEKICQVKPPTRRELSPLIPWYRSLRSNVRVWLLYESADSDGAVSSYYVDSRGTIYRNEWYMHKCYLTPCGSGFVESWVESGKPIPPFDRGEAIRAEIERLGRNFE